MTVMVAAMSSIFLRVALIAMASTFVVNTNAMQPPTKVTRSQRSEFFFFSFLNELAGELPVILKRRKPKTAIVALYKAL